MEMKVYVQSYDGQRINEAKVEPNGQIAYCPAIGVRIPLRFKDEIHIKTTPEGCPRCVYVLTDDQVDELELQRAFAVELHKFQKRKKSEFNQALDDFKNFMDRHPGVKL